MVGVPRIAHIPHIELILLVGTMVMFRHSLLGFFGFFGVCVSALPIADFLEYRLLGNFYESVSWNILGALIEKRWTLGFSQQFGYIQFVWFAAACS